MSVASFLDNLGITANENTPVENDKNLKQGQELMKFERQTIKRVTPQLKLLQITSIPGITSIVETLDNDDSTASSTQTSTVSINKLEDEFNKTLSEYTIVYKELSDNLMKKNQTQQDVYKYYNNVLTSSDGNYTYVNNYGYTHRYVNDAWDNNSASCPTDPLSISDDDIAKLKLVGPDMGSGQACQIAGTNIQNKDTMEVAWVDIKGYKHVYSSDVWQSKEESCEMKPTQIDNNSYNAIPSGNAMTTTTVCSQLDVDPQITHHLDELNTKLISLAQALSKDLDQMIVTDNTLKDKLDEQQQKLNTYIVTLNKEKSNLNHLSDNYYTIQGEEESSGLTAKSNWIHYIVWIILAITVISITMHTLSDTPSSRIGNGLALIFCIIALFVLVKWFYNKLTR
jgi:hypothetical protein